ncbi:DUF3168 domain-containing protein [Rummeliibacillus sp. NPDC094406]|uniref:DUF3168 domain-containing protein n=1 Tax=Rummeliibacillus sp. NPDC094406 TaxID=3364511 RepID=UPI00380074DC
MSLAFAPTQKAILDRVRGDIDVTSLLNKADKQSGIYDYVSESTPYPYIVVGEPSIDPLGIKNSEVVDLMITLHIWSNYKGNSEAYKILSAVHESFKYKLNISSYKTVKTSYRDAKVLPDIDGVHRHGVFTLLLTLEKERA